jgi:hypothetical protein
VKKKRRSEETEGKKREFLVKERLLDHSNKFVCSIAEKNCGLVPSSSLTASLDAGEILDCCECFNHWAKTNR